MVLSTVVNHHETTMGEYVVLFPNILSKSRLYGTTCSFASLLLFAVNFPVGAPTPRSLNGAFALMARWRVVISFLLKD